MENRGTNPRGAAGDGLTRGHAWHQLLPFLWPLLPAQLDAGSLGSDACPQAIASRTHILFFPCLSPRSAKSTAVLVHGWGRRRMDAVPCLAASEATSSISRCSLSLQTPLTHSLEILVATRALVTQQSLATAQPPAAQPP